MYCIQCTEIRRNRMQYIGLLLLEGVLRGFLACHFSTGWIASGNRHFFSLACCEKRTGATNFTGLCTQQVQQHSYTNDCPDDDNVRCIVERRCSGRIQRTHENCYECNSGDQGNRGMTQPGYRACLKIHKRR
jgi:hypothetical protein